MTEPLVITVRRAMELSTLGETTIYKLIKQGKIKSTLVLGRRLIDYQSFCALMGIKKTPEETPDPAAKAGEGTRRHAKGKRPKIMGNPERSEGLRRYAKGY